MVRQIIALSVIFICSWIAWGVLTAVVFVRTDESESSIYDDVEMLWGSQHIQTAPKAEIKWAELERRAFTEDEKRAYYIRKQQEENLDATKLGRKPRNVSVKEEELIEENTIEHQTILELEASEIVVDLSVDHRKKGLMWFATYTVDFKSRYTIKNPHGRPVNAKIIFPFPSAEAVYDDMSMRIVGDRADSSEVPLATSTEAGQMVGRYVLQPNEETVISFNYSSRGLDKWTYRFGDQVNHVRNLHLAMNTDFEQIDFPGGTISPDVMERSSDGGWRLVWDKNSLVSGLDIGMEMPSKINPGPLAASMSLHAPVSLFFFFFVMFILQTLRNLRIHPMNYFFIAASFFAFNLLFSYMVDLVNINVAFAVSSLVSIGLVVSYLKIVVGARYGLFVAGSCQLVYQVLFSLAHFFEGYTGLTITVGAILTLGVVMQVTARVDWGKAFEPVRDTAKPKVAKSPVPHSAT